MGKRRSKDRVINAEGRKLCEFIEERGWSIILNGNIRGDEEGEWTFTGGKGNTVIDYVIGNEDSRERVRRLRVGDRIDSDHHPIEIEIEGGKERERRRQQGGVGRKIWNDEGGGILREKMGEMGNREEEVEREWDRVEGKVKEAMRETEREMKKRKKKEGKGWWDEKCEGEKKKVREELKKWRREGGEGEEYRRRMDYKKLCERKKEENEKWERKVAEVKREAEVWEIVNRERRRREGINEEIGMEEWREYFMKLLRGGRGEGGKRRGRGKGGGGRREGGRGRDWEKGMEGGNKEAEGRKSGRDR